MIRRIALFVLLVGGLCPVAYAQVPSTLHYQASVLVDEQQVEGDIAVTARIFDAESGGQALWSEARAAVPVTEGRLSLLLGSETPFPGSLFDDSPRFLEIEIDGERLPRLPMASTAYALRAGVASAVVAGAVDAAALAPDAAVRSVNEVAGALTLEGTNGTTVNVDASTGVITISAPGGGDGSSGIFGIQNNDGALQVVDPNGPTTTINLQPGGIGPVQIANGGVQADELADGAVTTRKIADQTVTAAKLAPGAVVNTITAGPGLTGSETSGAVTLALADNGVTAAQLAENAVTRQALSPGVVVDNLNGLTGAVDLTSSDQSVNVTAADGRLDVGLSPDAAVTELAVGDTALRGPVALAAANGASLAVADGTITISAEGTGGTITGVTPGPGLAGGGTAGEVTLGIADGGVGPAQLADGAVTDGTLATSTGPSTGQVLGYDGSGLAWVSTAAGDISGVTAGGGLAGGGTTGTVELSVAEGGIVETSLATGAVSSRAIADGAVARADLAPGAAVTSLSAGTDVLTGTVALQGGPDISVDRVDGESAFRIAFTGSTGGVVTSVAGVNGLTTVSGPTGNVQLGVATGGVTGPRLADGVIQGGSNVTVTRDAGDNFVVSASTSGLTSAVESIGADGQTLDGDLTFETSGSASLSVSGNTLTFGASSGGLTSVATDGTLTGNGTSGSLLGVADDAITAAQLAANAVTSAAVAENTLTAADLAANSVGTSELSTTGTPSGGQVLGYNGSALEWTTAATGDITSVTGTGGLTGTTDSGDATVSIADGGVTGPRLADGVVQGGSNVTVTRDGSDNFVVSANVTTDGTTLTGDGNTTPLAIQEEGVGSFQLADGSVAAGDLNAGGQNDGYVLTYDSGEAGNLLWEAPGTITSSLRFKTNVETITDAAAVVERLRGVRFDWTADGRPDIGLIAEEVARVLPELVTYESDGTTVRGLRYAPLVAVLIEAAKGQQAALDAATETIEAQRSELAAQRTEIAVQRTEIAAQRSELEAVTERLARLEALVRSLPGADAPAQ